MTDPHIIANILKLPSRSNGLKSTSPNYEAGVRKTCVIKNFKGKPQLPANYGQNTLAILGNTVKAILTTTAINYTKEELYQHVENMCSHKMSAQLYDLLKVVCETHVKSNIRHFLTHTMDKEQFLILMARCWLEHCTQMILIRNIFLFLDRTYVLQNPTLASLWDMGLRLFRDDIIDNAVVQARTVEAILHWIHRERSGAIIDRQLLKRLLSMLSDLQLYRHLFEPPFLQATDRLYAAEGARLVQELDVPYYMLHVVKRLHEETSRRHHYLSPDTYTPLLQCVRTQLIEKHVTTLLEKGLHQMLHEYRLVDLTLLYELFSGVKDGLQELCKYTGRFIKKSGALIVLNPADDIEKDKDMVQQLLDFKDKMDNIIEQCFSAHVRLKRAVNEAFEHFINQRPNKPAELLAKYVNSKLRAGSKKVTIEVELERLLDKIVVLLRFIHGRDVFGAFYRKDLAKRLLSLGKSVSMDTEKSMLHKLKRECGEVFTCTMEVMITDVELSKDLEMSFRQYEAGRDSPLEDFDVTVNVLTSGFWPIDNAMEVHLLPDGVIGFQQSFDRFYQNNYSGRKLSWKHSLGHCLVKAHFSDDMKKELKVSSFQALCLLLFNEGDEFSFLEIKQATGIEEDGLRRILQSLACGKVRVLGKVPPGKEVHDSDKFVVNQDFQHKLYRIRINQVQSRGNPEEDENTALAVFRGRQYQVDAAIVRIMKMRKTLSHNLLISELFQLLHFPVKPSDLKKRIENLIDRDYIKRDEENPNQYHYVA